MAQLQWNQVEAPRLDTRDLALAGQTMDNAFGRFSEILNARDARLNKDATDARASLLLAAQTPEELAAAQAQAAIADPTGRADIRQLMGIANQRGQQITAQALDQSNLSLNQDKQAESNDLIKNGHLYQKALEAAGQGDHAGADAIFAQVRASGGGQAAASVTKDLMDQFSGFRKYELDKRQTDSSIANDRARTGFAGAELGMRQTEFNQGQTDRTAGLAGDVAGAAAADRLRLLDAGTAEAKLHAQPAYVDATQAVKQRMDAAFKTRYGQLTSSTGATDAALLPLDSKAKGVFTGLDAEKNRLINAQKEPMALAVTESQAAQGTAKKNSTVQTLQTYMPNFSYNSTETSLDKEMQARPGTQLSDFEAAAKNFNTETGKWTALFSNKDRAWAALGEKAQQIAELRGQGYGQNAANDLAMATAPLDATKAAITNLQSEMVRFERAAKESPLSAAEKATYDAQKAKLAELLAGSQKRSSGGSTGGF